MSHPDLTLHPEAMQPPAHRGLSRPLIILCIAGMASVGLGMYIAPVYMAAGCIALAIGTFAVRFLWNRPELSLLAMVFLTSSFIAPDIVDIRLPIGGLDLRDIGFLGLFSLIVVHEWYHHRSRTSLHWWSVSGPLLVFLSFAVFSLIYALLYRHTPANRALYEFRALAYYAIFFMATWSIRTPTHLRLVIIGCFFLADMTAIFVVLQQFFRDQHLLAAMAKGWRVEETAGVSGFGTTRIIPPGHVLVYVMTIVAFGFLVYGPHSHRQRIFFLAQFLFLNFGLLLTYTRSQWISAFLAICLITLFLPAADRRRLFWGTSAVVALGLLVVPLLSPETVGRLLASDFMLALGERFGSIFTPGDTLQTYSLQWRVYENGEALRSIREHPFLGVGLGGYYRDYTLVQNDGLGGDERFLKFIHNGYLYIAIKLGVPGLLAFVGLGVAFVINGYRAYTTITDPVHKRLALTLLASFVGLLSWCMTEPHLMMVESTSTIALLLGLVGSIYVINQKQQQ